MARKKKPEEHENHERWMVSYADFVTLLFAFFTCMYAISVVDTAKMGQMVASMKASFGGQIFDGGSATMTLEDLGSGGTSVSSAVIMNPELNTDDESTGLERSKDPNAQSKIVLSGNADMGRFKRTLEALLMEEIKSGRVRVYQERRGVVISLGETGMFDSGSVEIKPEGIPMLDTIATSLTSYGNHIRIEGHTDNIPINTWRFPSNWELSTGRSGTVLRRMESIFGMSPDLLSSSGYGENRPVATNSTAEGRARNRRVDIIVLNPSFARAEPM